MKVARFLSSVVAGGLLVYSQVAQADITVGVSLPLSGPAAGVGVPLRTALPFWPQEVAGQKIKVVVLDDGGDPAAATRNARRFVEDKVDVIVGTGVTPASVAMTVVANETQVPHFSVAPIDMPAGKDAWTYRIAMPFGFYAKAIVEHMKRSGVKTVAFLGLSDAYGDTYLQALKDLAKDAGLSITAIERFTRADTNVTAQALRVTSARPDAVLVASVAGGSALPQQALKDRGYQGKIYHGSATTSPDFIRLAGKDAEGSLIVSSPEQVPEQLPESHPARKVALDFVQRYEAVHGPGSRSIFASSMYDIGLVLQKAVPAALKRAQSGTPEFRRALKDAFDSMDAVATPKGMLRYTSTDHWGRDDNARIMLTIKDGKWTLVP